jgi:hypothetical protein
MFGYENDSLSLKKIKDPEISIPELNCQQL